MYPIPVDVVTPCADDPELMFADRRSAPVKTERAKAVCRPCPFRSECLSWALTRGEEGVWGATDEDERAEIRKREGIVAVRPVVNLPRGNSRVIPHGTPVGVESHRRKYQPLCETCADFDEQRRAS